MDCFEEFFFFFTALNQISVFVSACNMDWSRILCEIFIFFCSLSWLASSYRMLFFSSYHLLVYDKNQWKLKPATIIYKMQLLYTTHSKTPVVYTLRHNLCRLPPERYWSNSMNILQKDCWVQAQGNMWLLGLIYDLINNDLFLELCSLLHCFVWLSLLSLNAVPADLCQRPTSSCCPPRSVVSLIHTNGGIGEGWNDLADTVVIFQNVWQSLLILKVLVAQHSLHIFCDWTQFLKYFPAVEGKAILDKHSSKDSLRYVVKATLLGSVHGFENCSLICKIQRKSANEWYKIKWVDIIQNLSMFWCWRSTCIAKAPE